MSSSVDQNPVNVCFDQCGETPFAGTGRVADKHGGHHGDFEHVNLIRRRCGLVRRDLSRGWACDKQNQSDRYDRLSLNERD